MQNNTFEAASAHCGQQKTAMPIKQTFDAKSTEGRHTEYHKKASQTRYKNTKKTQIY